MSSALRKRWLAGLRHAWSLSGALDRWVEDRGITGVVYTPATWEPGDAGREMARLVDAGAKPDKALQWDLALTDIRTSAEVLRDAYDAADTFDGYVVVWIDPARANDPDKAVKAAAEVIGDVGRANVALGLAWVPQRAAVVERLVSNDVPLAISGVREQNALDAVAAARGRGMDKRREEIGKASDASSDASVEVPEVPVFLLGSELGADHLYGVELVTEFDLFGDRPGTGRVPLTPDAETSGLNTAIDRLAQRAKLPPHDDELSPPAFRNLVLAELGELDEDEVLEDVWARDHTIWKDDPTEIADRLGWLDVADRMWEERKQIAEFARRTRSACDAKHIVLLGMGGSALGAQTFASVYGAGVPLTVLDTTHPDHIAAVRDRLDLERTIFVVGSKSGTTIETRAHLEYFWSLVGRGDRFVAITDPGSELAKLGAERGFARVWENPPDIGGRYSALSYFGIVPAALCGIDIDPILSGARRAMVSNAPGARSLDASGSRLAAAINEARKDRRDKLTLFLPDRLRSLGDWIEQLIAESTGKEGVGVLPVVAEPFPSPESYGDDRLLVLYTLGDEQAPPQIAEPDDQPVVAIRAADLRQLGAEMYRWEMATAICGYLMDINPFDQPDVEAAKVRAREALSGTGASSRPEPGDAKALLEGIGPPSYVAIQAFVAPTDENARLLEAARLAIRDHYKVAVTVGFGPRYLHSTGQLHKGGPPTGVFLQVTDDRAADIDVPAMGFTFGQLLDAQADGDLLALRDLGRGVARVSLALLSEISGVG